MLKNMIILRRRMPVSQARGFCNKVSRIYRGIWQELESRAEDGVMDRDINP